MRTMTPIGNVCRSQDGLRPDGATTKPGAEAEVSGSEQQPLNRRLRHTARGHCHDMENMKSLTGQGAQASSSSAAERRGQNGQE